MEKIPIVNIDQEFPIKFIVKKYTIIEFQDSISIKPHRHNFYYLLFIQEGTGSHMIDFNSYTIAKNTFFFLKPGQVHHVDFTSQAKGYLIQFNSEFYHSANTHGNKLIRKLGRKNYYSFSQESAQKIEVILGGIFQEYKEKAFNYSYLIRSYLDILFTEIIRYSYSNKPLEQSEKLYQQERFEEFMEKIETHFTTHKKVSDYAEMMNLTIYQLNAITKAIINKTCSQLINEQIVLNAKRNLLATSNQINEIAFALGYDDPSYFIRFFKKHTGYSPEVFRHQFK